MFKITIILSLIAGAISCGSNFTTAENVPSPPSIQSAADSAKPDTKTPRNVVEEFMALVASGDLEKGRALLRQVKPKEARIPTKPVDPGKIKVGEDAGPAGPGLAGLDWAAYLHDRSFRLTKLLAEKVEGKKAAVDAELHVDDLKNSKQKVIFHLMLDDNRWVISEIEFVFDKPSVNRPNSNVPGA